VTARAKEERMPNVRRLVLLPALWLALSLPAASPLAAAEAGDGLSMKAGLGFEYFNRTVGWDENAFASSVRGYVYSLQGEVELRRGLAACFQAGYALSDFGGLVFRELPFSVEYQAGGTGGLFVGGGFKARASASKTFDVELTASLDVFFGFGSDWALEGLAVEGSLEGRPSWTRVAVGPVLWYKGLAYFVYPYVHVQYTALWGSFRMTETVASLEGTETKSVSGRGPVAVSVGVLSEVSDVIGLRAEATVVPRKSGLDVGASGRLVFSF
jgi:hypothetical protein